MRAWLEPAQLFDALINDDAAIYDYKMQPGECVLFDNLRVMHGRRAFDASGGSRWMRGSYIEREDFVSRVLHVPTAMAETYRGGEAWSREAEDAQLRDSAWFGEVGTRLDGLERGLREKGVKMDDESYQHLNGDFV
ncbi:hypothetical protein G7046_g7056 [Stylonectria norvegica]|nr:hypothetical protein G7046_g7056 [Stylonectria norvegica]